MHRLLVLVVMILEFDAKRNQFYLTMNDVVTYTQFTSSEVAEQNIDLKEISQATYRVMHGVYRGKNYNKQAKILQDMIIEEPEKQNGLMFAMLEFLRGAMVGGMDLNAYIANDLMQGVDRHNAPKTVKEELKINGLYFPGELL